jgi:hypothetical protein
MKAGRPVSKLQRSLYLAAAAAFCFFLVASAPHRVHHFFERPPEPATRDAAHAENHDHIGNAHHSHDHHDPDRDRRPQQENDCVVLSVAQNAHASLVQLFTFTLFDFAIPRRHEPCAAPASSFSSAPRSQRAPPLT